MLNRSGSRAARHADVPYRSSTSSGPIGRMAEFEARSQPSSTATGASVISPQPIRATRPSSSRATWPSRRSPCRPVAGSCPSAAMSGDGSAGEVRDELTGRHRRDAVERVPVGQQAVRDRQPVRPIPLRRGSRQQQEAVTERTPRPAPVDRRRPVVGPAHGVEARDRIDDAVQRRRADERHRRRPGPGDQLVRQVGHEDHDVVAVGGGPEIRRDERLDEPQAVVGDEALAHGDVACRAHDPIAGRDALQDEAFGTTLQQADGRAGPVGVRQTCRGDVPQPVGLEELTQRARRLDPRTVWRSGAVGVGDHRPMIRGGSAQCVPMHARITRRRTATRRAASSGRRPAARRRRRPVPRSRTGPRCR